MSWKYFILRLEPRKTMLRWAAWFSLFNTILVLAICSRYVGYMGLMEGALAHAYLVMAMIGHCSLLSFLVFALLLVPLILIWPNRCFIGGAGVVACTLGLAILLLDAVGYAQYRLHLSRVMLEMFVEAGDEIFAFSWVTWLIVLITVLMIFFVEVGIALFVWKKTLPHGRRWAGRTFAAVAIVAFLGSHFTHAWADVTYYRPITSTTRHIPLFYPMTAKHFLENHGIVNLAENREQRDLRLQTRHKGSIYYPRNPLQCDIKEKPFNNILFVVLDAWRFDMLNPEVTPNIHRFISERPTWSFINHMSGGNGTRIGIFSLFYGLFGTYWNMMSEEQIGPVFIHELLEREYQMGIFSGSRLTIPPFNRTVFNEVENLRSFPRGDAPWERDQNAVNDWCAWLDNRNKQRPFFGFLFFDSTHGYSFPPDYPRIFQPMWERVDHLSLTNDFDPIPYLNRYKTAVHYVDSLVERVLSDLESQGLLANTVVLFTGDHAEEFNDNRRGFWGHGGNYTRYQIHVPLVIYWPGREKATYAHTTTHMDVTPTLMTDLFGCRNPISDYSNGHHLLNPNGSNWFVAGGYFNQAIIEPNRITVTYPTGDYEIYDSTNGVLKGAKLNLHVVKATMDEISRFCAP